MGVADFAASLRFYRDQLGLEVLAVYDDPPYATLTAAGARVPDGYLVEIEEPG